MNAKRYPYRGFMLDVARHMMAAEDVCRIIDAAAACGMNRMHWHLTDDQGWRLEIKRWPRLAEAGSVRGESYFGAISGTENNNGFYTQVEIRRVVAFAREKGVEIVPEVEIPGHASAMLAAYPQFGCAAVARDGSRVESPYEYKVENVPGIFPNLLCAGKDAALRFMEDVLDEVAELFPGPEVHIGGDEALKTHWRRCPDCQRRIREEGLAGVEELQRWLVLKMGAHLAERGKKVIVWNESLAGGLLPEHFIVQHWHGNDDETRAFMDAGGSVICSDVAHYYLDYPYADTDAYGIWQAPLPEYARGHEDRLLGGECPLWTERVTNADRAAELLFPRLPALALKLSGRAWPDWEAFRGELVALRERTAPLGLRWAEEWRWRLTEADAARDRAEDDALRVSPEVDAALAEQRALIEEDREMDKR